MAQLAKLYLRGDLINVTAAQCKEHPEILEKVEEAMQLAWDDSQLQNAKHEFCMALGGTIGNEYKNKEAGMVDAYIAFWRCAVFVVAHQSEKCQDCGKYYTTSFINMDRPYGTRRQDICDRCGSTNLIIKSKPNPTLVYGNIERKKMFQSFLFNYLRQILNENKIPTQPEKINMRAPASSIANSLIIDAMRQSREDIQFDNESQDDVKIIKTDPDLLPLDIIDTINKVQKRFKKHGVTIKFGSDHVSIIPAENDPVIDYAITNKRHIKEISIHKTTDDDDNDSTDHISFLMYDDADNETMNSDTVKVIRERCPDECQEIMDIIMNTPTDYVDKFGNRIAKSYLAKYLGVSLGEINRRFDIIKTQCTGVGLH